MVTGIATLVIALTIRGQLKIAKNASESTRDQTEILKKQFESEYRPWIGALNIGFIDGSTKKDKFFEYKNYGKIPARILIEKWQISKQPFNLDELDRTKMNSYEESITFPTQERKFSFSFSDEYLSALTKNEINSLFVCIIIEYVYADDKKGEYGVVTEFFPDGGIYIRKEWVK